VVKVIFLACLFLGTRYPIKRYRKKFIVRFSHQIQSVRKESQLISKGFKKNFKQKSIFYTWNEVTYGKFVQTKKKGTLPRDISTMISDARLW